MAAHVFARQGYFTAHDESELARADRHNRGGYWEAKWLVRANVEVFREVGYTHHNTWLHEPMPESTARLIADLEPLPGHRELVQSYQQRAPWLWKDPRLCYTLGYWWKLMPPESTCVLLIERDLEHVFQSFVRMSWRENTPAAREETIARLGAHMTAARRAIAELDIPHVAVTYEDFERSTDRVAGEIAAAFDIPLEAPDLGFVARRNHSHDHLRGRLSTRVQRSLTVVNQLLHGR
jgi:hypothetical protein